MKNVTLPRVNAMLLLAFLGVVVLYYGRLFLIPVGFALLFSMLMLPVARKLERWGVDRIPSTLLCILLILLFLAGVLLLIIAQAVTISEDWPQMQPKLQQLVASVQEWIRQQFGVAPQEQIKVVQEQIQKFSQSANQLGTSILKGSLGLVTSFALVLLYMFFLLWKREKYREFFLRLYQEERHAEVNQVLNQITKVAGQYLAGRLISIVFIAVIYAIGFSIIGLPNALLLAPIAALPILIPYVGAFVGAVFPLVFSLVGGSTGMVLPTMGVLVVAQVLDNNLVEPIVMGAKLNLSPIFTIIAVVSGELIWGVAGMILFEPLFAVIKILCDHVQPLHPYGFLLGNEVKEPGWLKKLKQTFS
ncbi:AI-2E family transporter [Rufibacter latericius]|uniref:AI-2E family transporter n=1 Tax=Rufibacter latericius TaxID=2487040 RepID=A0A3M9N0J3_9BACT|nr:AI-2E family transporter [Rufibacter latericius]RNI31311.1 AI-2E family transporter [Rufibacter latericius]